MASEQVQPPDPEQPGSGQRKIRRGAGSNPANRYHTQSRVTEEWEGLDEPEELLGSTTFIPDHPRKLINEVLSPDVRMELSANPYQGCEHGCAYCYARPTHAYWGYSPGLDFEQKILVKEEAARLLEREITRPGWVVRPVVFSGNTDCYQPAERKFRITRSMLEVLLRYKHPAGIITKNKLILRDLDILTELQVDNLIQVHISLTTLNEKLRRVMEPRTAAAKQRLTVIRELSAVGIPVNVMVAPVIPGLNAEEIPAILEHAAEAGARSAAMQLVRLNGEVAIIFEQWLREHFPDRADKVLNQIRATHAGKLNDPRFGYRMRGEGPVAEAIVALFRQSRKRFFTDMGMPELNTTAFLRPHGQQLDLF